MLQRVVHLTLVGAALLFFAENGDARGRGGRGGCGGGGCGGGGYSGGYGGGCGGGGCGGGYGGGYGGFAGGYGGFGGGCPGGVCGMPAAPTTPPTPPPAKDGADKTVAPANLVVNLPADAKLYVDGHRTTSTTAQRLLTTPALQPGREYHYTLRAEVVRDGQTQQVEQRVAVRAGQQTRVNLEVPTAVASR